jgi:hypothetical protein
MRRRNGEPVCEQHRRHGMVLERPGRVYFNFAKSERYTDDNRNVLTDSEQYRFRLQSNNNLYDYGYSKCCAYLVRPYQ